MCRTTEWSAGDTVQLHSLYCIYYYNSTPTSLPPPFSFYQLLHKQSKITIIKYLFHEDNYYLPCLYLLQGRVYFYCPDTKKIDDQIRHPGIVTLWNQPPLIRLRFFLNFLTFSEKHPLALSTTQIL